MTDLLWDDEPGAMSRLTATAADMNVMDRTIPLAKSPEFAHRKERRTRRGSRDLGAGTDLADLRR